MMGAKERHFAPLIHVSLEEMTPQDHFYRQMEQTLDLSFVREFVQETYAGKELHFAPWHSTERSLRYQAYGRDCNHCPLKAQCTTSKQGRSLCRSIDEAVLDRVQRLPGDRSLQKGLSANGTVWVEPLFAEGKDWHGMRRFRLRRLWWVNCEALMIASGQNLNRLLKKVAGDGVHIQQRPYVASFWLFLSG